MSLSIIHFSDIHITDENDCFFDKIEKLKQACAGAIKYKSKVVIDISGDIAYSGKEAQYTLAKSIFDEITEYITKEKEAEVQFVIAPGNHDCDFGKEDSIRQILLGAIKNNSVDKKCYDAVSAVQEDFFNFVKGFDIDTDNVLSKKEVVVNGEKVLFVMINTAWMSIIKEDPGRICMPVSLFEEINPSEYKAVIYTYHHPDNWIDPECRFDFVNHIRQNADMVLLGHEHTRDNYESKGTEFSFYVGQGKELQDDESEESAFSVINFDSMFQNYEVIDFVWNGEIYDRVPVCENQYHKNIASERNIYSPNKETIDYCNDMGVAVNHFAKEDIVLTDLFVWPDINKCDYRHEKSRTKYIRADVYQELCKNELNIMIAGDSGCKTAFAKKLYLMEAHNNNCCLLIKGKEFTSSDEHKTIAVIESAVEKQYSKDMIESFRQLPKEEKMIIIDDFEQIKINNNRRINVLNYLCGYFGKVTIFLSSVIDITSIISCDKFSSTETLYYYEILPLGNRKRKELITRWYSLCAEQMSEEDISKRIEEAQRQIDIIIGNGAAFIPAMPIFIISALQNIDANKHVYDNSKYGVLYESLIMSSLSKISKDYILSEEYNADLNIFSKLAFHMLCQRKTFFTIDNLNEVIEELSEEFLVDLEKSGLIPKMEEAKIIYRDSGSGDVYRFKYPYIYYFFAGRYIAYNLKEEMVKEKLKDMSSKLHNETYGNVLIFVCHFNNNEEVIDDILKSSYEILTDYEVFDFNKSNSIFDKIKDAIEALVPKVIAGNGEVGANKDRALIRMDEAGIKDGNVTRGEDIIEDEVSDKEKDMVAVTSALKTIEVLGQILQNYPINVKGNKKIDIIDEMHKLGMRSVQAIIKTMGYIEEELVEFVYDNVKRKEKNVKREDVVHAVNGFVNMLILGMARGMVHQVANSLNSNFLLKASTEVFEKDESISSKLILLDLKVNCLKKVDYHEIKGLKKVFDDNNEKFATRILDSIIGHYLNYNKCDHALRAKLCALCGFQEKENLIENKKNTN